MPRPPKGAVEASDTKKRLLVVNEISKGIKVVCLFCEIIPIYRMGVSLLPLYGHRNIKAERHRGSGGDCDLVKIL
jgi:hypothetical protein